MNFTQSFEEFSAGLQPVDLALYAGVGVILWVLFKDKLSPIQKMVIDFVEDMKTSWGSAPKPPVTTPAQVPVSTTSPYPVGPIPAVTPDRIPNVIPSLTVPSVNPLVRPQPEKEKDVFFELVTSWKKTRDLAAQAKCGKAVEAVDAIFPYLSPTVCDKDGDNNNAE